MALYLGIVGGAFEFLCRAGTHRRFRIFVPAIVVVLAFLATPGTLSAAPAYPLKVGPTSRYLVDKNGVPFLMAGDSPQAMIGNLSEADAELFLANRKAHGFNTVWINLLCASYTACNADGSTFDGIRPFTVGTNLFTYDLATPNEAYFARADRILQLGLGFWGPKTLLSAVELGVFTELAKGAQAVEALTARLGLHPRAARDFLDLHERVLAVVHATQCLDSFAQRFAGEPRLPLARALLRERGEDPFQRGRAELGRDAVAAVGHGHRALQAGGFLALDERVSKPRPDRGRPRVDEGATSRAPLHRGQVAVDPAGRQHETAFGRQCGRVRMTVRMPVREERVQQSRPVFRRQSQPQGRSL